MCVACPHLGIYYTLAQIKNLTISGDIGCYTLGAGHPWNALDTTISMGASMGVALGIDKGRGAVDKNKRILAVIGDSTFMHMGMQGLLDITYNRGNVTVLLLDNRAVGMTGGQANPGTGRDIHGEEAPAVDFAKLVEALGVKKERITSSTPTSCRCCSRPCATKSRSPKPSVIITDRPCVLIDDYKRPSPTRSSTTSAPAAATASTSAARRSTSPAARRWSSPRARKSSWPSCASRPRPAPAAACASSPARRTRSSTPMPRASGPSSCTPRV
jgi:TPP-dependent indolepyruvate ferredoxin oxidoreductase alpha subunit